MKVAFYSDPFASRHPFGVARYSRQLCNALRETQADMELTPVSVWSDLDSDGLKEIEKEYEFRLLPWGRPRMALLWAFLDMPKIEHWFEGNIDLVHQLQVASYPVATKKPLVTTVHDLGPLTHPQFFSASHPWMVKISLKRAVKRAGAIICVSQSTANELESYIGHGLGDRLHVIWEGVDSLFFSEPDIRCLNEISEMPAMDVPFILAAGAISPRKNVIRIIQALEKLLDVIPHHLVFAGKAWWDSHKTLQQFRDSPVADRIHFLGYVSDEKLHALYSLASVFVYPSLYEGFGLPILEAMASGCPVITSNIFSMPEVACDAAMLVYPYDVDAIAEAIHAICTDNVLANRLIDSGKKRAEEFTWEKCAVNVASIYMRFS